MLKDTIIIHSPDLPEGYGAFDQQDEPTEMDLSKIDNIKFDDVDYNDYPDFCDAFISSADYNGEPMDEDQLELLNEDREFIHEKLFDQLF